MLHCMLLLFIHMVIGAGEDPAPFFLFFFNYSVDTIFLTQYNLFIQDSCKLSCIKEETKGEVYSFTSSGSGHHLHYSIKSSMLSTVFLSFI